MRSPKRGLTLVEMMVGFLGIAIILNVLLASIVGGLKVERTSEMRMKGVRLAASRRAVVEMTPFDKLGPLGGIETVQVGGQDYTVETHLKSESVGDEERYLITIDVRWKDGARNPSFGLTLKRSKL